LVISPPSKIKNNHFLFFSEIQRGEQDEFVSQSLVHVSSTLPRPPRPPWTNSSNHHVGSSVQRFNVTAPPSSASSAAAAAALAASKKESSV
jgi:hypothetical protein